LAAFSISSVCFLTKSTVKALLSPYIFYKDFKTVLIALVYPSGAFVPLAIASFPSLIILNKFLLDLPLFFVALANSSQPSAARNVSAAVLNSYFYSSFDNSLKSLVSSPNCDKVFAYSRTLSFA